jgi:hypothetical protein
MKLQSNDNLPENGGLRLAIPIFGGSACMGSAIFREKGDFRFGTEIAM